MEISIAYLYPNLMNLYGDRGNIITLKKRLEDRGIGAKITEYSLEDNIDFEKTDILYIGGGSERSESLVLKKLMEFKEDIKGYVENGGVLLAVCSGYEMLGKYIKTDKEKKDALGILDIHTEYRKKRIIGDVILESELFGFVAGFENRYGKVSTGTYAPLGCVSKASSKRNDSEGVIYKNTIGTHLHGPLLPKNPKIADYLIGLAMKKKYNTSELAALDDTLEMKANEFAVKHIQ